MTLWTYNPANGRYQLTREGARETGQRPGTFIGRNNRIKFRDRWVDSHLSIVDQLAIDFDNGSLSLNQWLIAMDEEMRISSRAQYVLGRGGLNSMTNDDWQLLSGYTNRQHDFLIDFARDIANKDLSLAEIQRRARLYIEGSTALYERATAIAAIGLDMPEYPGDGNQICMSNCRCQWVYVDRGDRWECTWKLDVAAAHCESCLANAGQWNPLVIPK